MQQALSAAEAEQAKLKARVDELEQQLAEQKHTDSKVEGLQGESAKV